ncbi:MAG: hypothetical protein AB8E15_08945 [Bdellovibrionales bacterium]
MSLFISINAQSGVCKTLYSSFNKLTGKSSTNHLRATFSISGEFFSSVVQGNSSPGKLRYYDSSEFRQLAARGKSFEGEIVLLKKLPEMEVLPLAEAYIFSNNIFSLRYFGFSHLVNSAEKQGIPLVSFSYRYFNRLKESNYLQKVDVILEVSDLLNRSLIRRAIPEDLKVIPKATIPEVPILKDLSIARISSSKSLSLESYGDKFLGLRDFHQRLPQWSIPKDAVSIPSSYFFSFQNSLPSFNGKTFQKRLEEIDSSRNLTVQQYREMADHLLSARKNPDTLRLVTEVSKEIVKGLKLEREEAVSIRSNNTYENILGSGVFQSKFTKDSSIESLVKAIFEVWESSYSLEALRLFQRNNMSLEFHSMPLLVHRFIPNQTGSGILQFYGANSSMTSFNFGAFISDKSNGPITSPKNFHDVYSVNFSINPITGQVKGLRSPGKLEKKIVRLAQDEMFFLRDNMYRAKEKPISIDYELAINPGRVGDNVRVSVLQVSKVFQHEVTSRVVRGELKTRELSEFAHEKSYDDFSKFLEGSHFRKVDSEYIKEFALSSNTLRDRFFVVNYNDNLIMLSYSKDTSHGGLVGELKHFFPDIAVLYEGYIVRENRQLTFEQKVGLVRFSRAAETQLLHEALAKQIDRDSAFSRAIADNFSGIYFHPNFKTKSEIQVPEIKWD